MTLELIDTLWQLGEIFPEQFPKIATDLLQSGLESESLIMLAGLVKPDRDEADKFFNKAITELKGNKVAREDIPYYIAKAIVEEHIKPERGAYLIGELSEEFKMRESIWNFKCLTIEYDDFVDEEKCYVDNKEYNLEMIKGFKQGVIDDIYKAARNYIETRKLPQT